MSLANWFSLLCPTPPRPAQPGLQQPGFTCRPVQSGLGREGAGSGVDLGQAESPPTLGSPSASFYLRWVEAHKIEKALLEISLALPSRGRHRPVAGLVGAQ